ncbi:Bug family tripartite tricarboxylate transporter substrate binding protein [Sabulicella glaciei]|uniref:Tripartite tricarboxylate transporter substrate binding protein n=1 Tax=Sabulicella glaciei TaxID=2984948 RepID=A0ABT3NPU3_9PROT|nr:tripartite tricarboxylate transporter substrate binding protein [Roseococcus sp. MDT2-1-1]MCW8084186.1 tripartite tricarboxylate transporter substrate binding protein [Roseococcus sp. MDT2-1-1]
MSPFAMRRRHAFAAGLALPFARTAFAQGDYPSRPVTVVIGFTPAGLTDTMTRIIAGRMGRELGQNLVVENRPGAATSIASAHVAQARADGYTLLMGTASLAINPALQPSLPPRDPRQDLAPVGMAYESPFLLIVRADLPIRDLADFVAHARAHPGRIEMGSSGTGATNHLLIAMLAREAGIQLEHIPYRGAAAALTDLRGGRIAATWATPPDAMPLVGDGTARALAVSSRERMRTLPDVPAAPETLPGVHGTFWQGLFAPPGTPEPVLARLGAALDAATRDPEIVRRAEESGVVMRPGDGGALRAYLASETERWSTLIRAANIRAE